MTGALRWIKKALFIIFEWLPLKLIKFFFLEGESPTLSKSFKQSNVWQNPNDLNDETDWFKQPHIAIELVR